MFTACLAANLAGALPPGASLPAATDPAAIQALPEAVRAVYLDAFAGALSLVFVSAASIGAVAFVLAWFLEDAPLRTQARAETIAESFAMPHDATSLEELEQIAAQLQRHENRWPAYQRLAEAAGVPLAPDELWLLVQLCLPDGPSRLAELARRFNVSLAQLEEIAGRMQASAMVTPTVGGEVAPAALGREAFQRMVTAHRAVLERLCERWGPEKYPEAKQALDGLARSLLAEIPVTPTGN